MFLRYVLFWLYTIVSAEHSVSLRQYVTPKRKNSAKRLYGAKSNVTTVYIIYVVVKTLNHTFMFLSLMTLFTVLSICTSINEQ